MPLRTFGRYEVAQQLGAGAFGAVYRAWDEKLGRHVALKLLHHDFDEDVSVRARFEREAKIMATLQHPHIVPIHDFGEQDGTLFIVMALFAGGTLQRRLAERAEAGKTFSSEETLAILTSVCSALDRAHSLGVVHRDLKPGNILFDEVDKLAITDFGIARIFAGTATRATLTQSGQEIGTPLYMAPEQWRGAKEQIDGRTDLYALGCLAYHLLTGSAPFAGDSAYSLMHAHMFTAAPRPSDSRKDLPVPWDQGVARLLAKDPADRFETAGAFLQWLREALAGRLVPLPGPKTVAPAPNLTATANLPAFATSDTLRTAPARGARRRGPWLVLGAVGIVVAGLAAGWWLRRPGAGGALDGPGARFRGRDPLLATVAAPFQSSVGLTFLPAPVLPGGRPLLFARTETRVRDFRAFVQDGRGHGPGDNEPYRYDLPKFGARARSLTARGWAEAGATWAEPGFVQSEDHPVTCVSFHDAMSFADWLTEREWETGYLPKNWRYRVPFGSEWAQAGATLSGGGELANFAGEEARDSGWPPGMPVLAGRRDAFPRTAPVGEGTGVSGVRGNVWEWTLPHDPGADRTGAELRGGAWSSNREEETIAGFIRPEPRSLRRSDTGFRLVLVQEAGGRPAPPPLAAGPNPTARPNQPRVGSGNAPEFRPGAQVVPAGQGAPAFPGAGAGQSQPRSPEAEPRPNAGGEPADSRFDGPRPPLRPGDRPPPPRPGGGGPPR